MSDIISIQQRVEQRARQAAANALSQALDKVSDVVNNLAYPETGYGYCRPLTIRERGGTAITSTFANLRPLIYEAVLAAFEKDISSRATDAFLRQVDKLQSDLDALNDSVQQ